MSLLFIRKALPLIEIAVIIVITVLNIVLGVREEQLKKTDVSKKIQRFLTRCQCKWNNHYNCVFDSKNTCFD